MEEMIDIDSVSVKFGPSGNSKSFYMQGYKSSIDAPKWLYNMGLNAYEYPLTRGVNIGEKTARAIGKEANRWGMTVSVHAPYYINLASPDRDIQQNSKKHIRQSMKVAKWIGANRVVFHPGSCGERDRKTSIETILRVLDELMNGIIDLDYNDIILCPETAGKQKQIGTLEEIVGICKTFDSFIPTIDFAHLHARDMGAIKDKDDYRYILDYMIDELGRERIVNFHAHFSRIEYTNAGELRHRTLSDEQYGPEFEPLAELLIEYDLEPIIICESREQMAEDACRFKKHI